MNSVSHSVICRIPFRSLSVVAGSQPQGIKETGCMRCLLVLCLRREVGPLFLPTPKWLAVPHPL